MEGKDRRIAGTDGEDAEPKTAHEEKTALWRIKS